MLKYPLLMLVLAVVTLAAVDYQPPNRRRYREHHGGPRNPSGHHRPGHRGRHGHRQHGHHGGGHHGHHGRPAYSDFPDYIGGHHGHHGRPEYSDYPDYIDDKPVAESPVNSFAPSWLDQLIEPLEPIGQLQWPFFGEGPWWKGPNVCKNVHETVENVTSSESNIDGAPITHHHFFTRASCDETPTAHRCTTIINVGGVKKTVTVTLECCHGYQRAKGQPGCPTELELRPLPETMRNVGASEMLRGLETTGLISLLSDGNYTVFAPKDQAFKELMIEPDRSSQENVVVITPEMRGIVGNVESVLMSHVVPGIIRSGLFSDELLLPTSSPGVDIRINIYDNPKQIVTANCVPIERADQMSENGVVHIMEDLLPTADLTVADIVSKDPQLSTLKTMIGRLGIVQTLRSNGQYTLFAPTNAAFESIKPSLLNKLLEGNSCLGTLVRTHLLPNVICSSIVIGKVKTRNVLGHFVNLTRDENEKLWLGHGQITKKDIMASNGVVHLVDKVIIPDDVLDVLEVAKEVGATDFVKLIKQAGLTKEIETMGNVTLFLPSNQAVKALSEEKLSELRADPTALTELIKFHVSPGLTGSSSIRHNRRIQTLNSDKSIAVKEFYSNPFGIRRVTTAQCAPISHRDLETCNGIVHIIDKVMVPPRGDVLDTLSQMPNMSTTISLLKKFGLAESLQEEGPFTFIAPSNRAWEALGETLMDRLTSNSETFKGLLKHHITSGTICCAGIFHSRWLYKQRERMLDSSTLGFNKNGNTYLAGRHTPISQCDVTATNGVVHVIDAVLPEAIKKYGGGNEREEEEEEEEISRERGRRPYSQWRRHMENLRRQWHHHMPNFDRDLLGNMNMHWDAFLDRMRGALDSRNWANLRFRFGSKKK